MTPDRALDFARRIASRAISAHRSDSAQRDDEYVARQILPILYEAVVEMAEDHLASVLAVGSKVGSAS